MYANPCATSNKSKNMKFPFSSSAYFLAIFLVLAVQSGITQEQGANTPRKPATFSLIDFDSADSSKQVAPSKGCPASLITVNSRGISLSFPIQPAPHTGVHVTPANGTSWDLSAYGHVEAKVTNTGKKNLPFVMHVVNGKEDPREETNTEWGNIRPGETQVLTVYFGYQYGFEPSLLFNPSNVREIYMFIYDTADPHSFRVEELKAGGIPGEQPRIDPQTLAYKPKNGVIFGDGVTFDLARQLETDGSQVSSGPNGSLAVAFLGDKKGSIKLKPAIGSWNLTDANQLRVKFKNIGQTPVTPTIALASMTVTSRDPIAVGAETEIIAFFDSPLLSPDTKLESDKVTEIGISSEITPGARSLLITSVVADAAIDTLPEWLGKKPPAEGDWVQTFDEEFSGSKLDFTKWNIYGNIRIPRSWGWNANHNPNRRAHFSKDELVLGNGNAVLRFEKKAGKHNDAEDGPQTDYACGYLSTLGKWTQRYGYFESRMKLPNSTGLWAAFTLMPDRGKAVSVPATRFSAGKAATDAGAGGLEFDPMNFLSRMGAYRITVGAREGLHTDKSAVSHTCYLRADQDGYITSGLLWLPGIAVFYNNGKEIFRWENARVSDVQSYVRFDLVTGGVNNNQLDDTTLPADFSVDYVRAWQRKDLASPQDGPKPSNGDPDEGNN